MLLQTLPLLLLLFALLVPPPANAAAGAALALHESPYFLPAVTPTAAPFSADAADPVAHPAGAFRVLGATTGGTALNYEEAFLSCLDLAGGRGLAAVSTSERRAALDVVVEASQAAAPANEDFGCCDGGHWIAAFRTNLTDIFCQRSNVTHWPYFTVTADGSEAEDYTGCGKDKLHDWAWETVTANGSRSFEQWRDSNSGAEQWWEIAETTGVGNNGQPTGWNGDKTIEDGSYENCTGTIMYLASQAPDIRPVAYNISWYKDFTCTAPLERWVCEMEDEGVGYDAACVETAEARGLEVSNSPYFIAGVSNLTAAAADGTTLRLLGVSATLNETYRDNGLPAVSWQNAQLACTQMGASGLAVPDPDPASNPVALISAALSAFPAPAPSHVWIGASSAAPTPAATSNWTAYATINIDRKGEIEEEGTEAAPLAAAQWAAGGFPRTGADAVDAEAEEGEATSCLALSTAAAIAGDAAWVNRLCDDEATRLFICAFPDDTTGMAAADGSFEDTCGAPVATGGSDSLSTGEKGAIAGGVVGAIALVAILVAAVYYCCARGSAVAAKAGAASKPGKEGEKGVGAAGADARGAPPVGDNHGALFYANDANVASRNGGGCWMQKADQSDDNTMGPGPPTLVKEGSTTSNGVAAAYNVSSVLTASTLRDDGPGGSEGGAVGHSRSSRGEMPHSSQLAFLNAQLDAASNAEGWTILNTYRLLNACERRTGGQGVVQFAKGVHDRCDYAVKFYLRPAAFETERALYANPALKASLPSVRHIISNSEAELIDPAGQPLPPCMIMERGESLNDWSQRAKPDVFSAIQVLAHVGQRLCDLHAAGFVHRDLKPGNVMWLPRENRWTVIDFGCVALIGRHASVSFSLGYAAPEAVRVAVEGPRKEGLVVTPALDTWSLGVMAFEMLTGEAALDVQRDGKDSVVARLCGREPLPWEGENFTAARRAALGILKQPILMMLDRDPSQRPTMAQFRDTCNAIFASRSTSTIDVSNTWPRGGQAEGTAVAPPPSSLGQM